MGGEMEMKKFGTGGSILLLTASTFFCIRNAMAQQVLSLNYSGWANPT
jgi:hypothetical protein